MWVFNGHAQVCPISVPRLSPSSPRLHARGVVVGMAVAVVVVVVVRVRVLVLVRVAGAVLEDEVSTEDDTQKLWLSATNASCAQQNLFLSAAQFTCLSLVLHWIRGAVSGMAFVPVDSTVVVPVAAVATVAVACGMVDMATVVVGALPSVVCAGVLTVVGVVVAVTIVTVLAFVVMMAAFVVVAAAVVVSIAVPALAWVLV